MAMRKFLIAAAGLVALAAPALAADMAPVPRTYTKAPIIAPAPVYNWTGFYVGAEGGYAWGDSYQAQSGVQTDTYHPKGGFGGATFGYNWQFSQWVFGLETDFSGADIKGSLPVGDYNGYGCEPGPCESKLDWFGTVRGRVGYAVNGVLLYGTGGYAYGRVHTDIATAIGFDGTSTRSGWAAGAGLEYMFAPAWSAKVEYLHIDLGHFGFGTDTPTPTTKFEDDTIKVGINYHFGWGGPVVARY